MARPPLVPVCLGRRALSGTGDDLGEETTAFLHRSMYPQRERILYTFANALHERQHANGTSELVSTEEVRQICYRGTKLQDQEVDVVVALADPDGETGLVDLGAFVQKLADTLRT